MKYSWYMYLKSLAIKGTYFIVKKRFEVILLLSLAVAYLIKVHLLFALVFLVFSLVLLYPIISKVTTVEYRKLDPFFSPVERAWSVVLLMLDIYLVFLMLNGPEFMIAFLWLFAPITLLTILFSTFHSEQHIEAWSKFTLIVYLLVGLQKFIIARELPSLEDPLLLNCKECWNAQGILAEPSRLDILFIVFSGILVTSLFVNIHRHLTYVLTSKREDLKHTLERTFFIVFVLFIIMLITVAMINIRKIETSSEYQQMSSNYVTQMT